MPDLISPSPKTPTPETTLRQRLVRVALRQEPADLVIRNAQIVSVTTRELLSGDVAIAGGYIAAIGEGYQAAETVDAQGRYLSPGLIDGHIHIESSMLTPASFALAVRPHGTTAVIAEPHEIVNVLGETGLRWMLEAGEASGVQVWASQPSCVPASSFEQGGAHLKPADIARGLQVAGVLGLAEMMNYPGVLNADTAVWATLQAARGQRIDGHAAGLAGDDLQAYAAAGIHSDHEATTEAEARERLRAGMWLMVREGAAARNLQALLPVLREQPRRAMLVSDDISADWLLVKGHLDYQLRQLVKGGIDPLYALSLATCNAAEYWGRFDVGCIAAGFRADLVLFEDLQDFKVSECWLGGQPLAALKAPLMTPPLPGGAIELTGLAEADLRVPATWPVIGVRPDQIETYSAPTGSADSKLVIADRYGRGLVAAAWAKGIGLQRGAVALSVLHDAHHVVMAGALGPQGDADIKAAGQAVERLGGGAVVVENGQIIAELALPYGGLMSDQAPAEVAAQVQAIHAALHQRGCLLPEALTTLSFLGLSVIPELKLTPNGLLDVQKWELLAE